MTPKDLTHKLLISWGGATVFNQALSIAKNGELVSADWNPETRICSGKIAQPDGWEMPVSFRLMEDGLPRSECPCATNRVSGLICRHVVAVGLYLMCRMNDPEAEEEHRAAKRRTSLDASRLVKRSPAGIPLRLSLDWDPATLASSFAAGTVPATLAFFDRSGRRFAPEDPSLRSAPGVRLAPAADKLLSLLEEVCGGEVRTSFGIPAEDFLAVAAMLARTPPAKCILRAKFREEDGSFTLSPALDRPGPQPVFLVGASKGFAWFPPEDTAGRGEFVPLANLLPEPFRFLYSGEERVDRANMHVFIRENLPVLRKLCEVEIFPSEDMFSFVPDSPRFVLEVIGSAESLVARLHADYSGTRVACGEPGPALCRPDPSDTLLYRIRNPKAEAEALKTIHSLGFSSREGSSCLFITKRRDALNFLGSGGPVLARMGWRVEFSEELDEIVDNTLGHVIPAVEVSDVPGGGKGDAEIGCTFDDGGRNVPQAEIQAAINRGDSFLVHKGETLIFDSDAVSQMRSIFADCPSTPGARPGRFRVGALYAPYVRSSLGAFSDAVVLEDEKAPDWSETAARRNRDESAKWEPVPLGPLESTLRPYQKEGVAWMRFLEKSGLSGLLADEMGLGKTLQTLTWLSLERTDPEARGKPALVVCPTSLVQNWAAEAEKFVPSLKRLVVSGPSRADSFASIPEADLVITSYALLQRDLEEAYLGRKFGVVVLDEAQHVKNRKTQNARAAKRLDSVQKLALTGTPVENSVSDVWSIFDFLMPGYLGAYDLFKSATQDVIECGGEAARAEQERLHRKLHPFILRRLKESVAKDLPEKIVKVVPCPMTTEQQIWYNRLLEEAKSRIGSMVGEKGFAKSRMEILAVLMRLRQTACHLGLVKQFREANPEAPADDFALSGKLDAFFELLDEAIAGGHRVLVFSQFVTMLAILRNALAERSIPHCYLDGETKDRLGECRKFNTTPSIPVFLISLHAGGTGLNLTGADMVVHFDPWWNPAVEAQATDRAHRIGQKRTVYVVKLIAEHSVEERVLELQRRKQLVIDATVGSTDEAAVRQLTYEDVKSIIGL